MKTLVLSSSFSLRNANINWSDASVDSASLNVPAYAPKHKDYNPGEGIGN